MLRVENNAWQGDNFTLRRHGSKEGFMRIELKTDSDIEGHDELARYVETVVTAALEHDMTKISKVDVQISGVPGATADDICCMVEAHLEVLHPLAVTHQASTVHETVRGAAAKLKHAVNLALGRDKL
jgi:hypothetical protein